MTPSMRLVAMFLAATPLAAPAPGLAQHATADAPALAGVAARCAALKAKAFGQLPDAPTSILKVAYVATSAASPAYCQVEGYVTPNAGFGMRFPAEGWNGKLIARGCGGMCGIVDVEFACADPVRQGYACVQTDMGHKSGLSESVWAYNNWPARIDFAYRATHVTTLAGKAILAAFYGADPQRSYFLGCSTGGRQALVEAQRFPDDFDGIVAIGPVVNETGTSVQLAWSVLANTDATGAAILTEDKLAPLHAAALAACDPADSLKEGVIGDPRACRFDPAVIACRGAETPACLTPDQVTVARKIYAGPPFHDAGVAFTGAPLPGSELAWKGEYVLPPGGAESSLTGDFWRYMAFDPNPGPAFRMTDLDFHRDIARLGVMEALYTAANPDLRGFKAHGGKLILVQGLSDAVVTPPGTLDYYELATRTMGGPAATMDFFRLFAVPGAHHCVGGGGATVIDYIGALDAWVAHGQAPDRLIAVRPKAGAPTGGYLGVAMPLAPDQIDYARPVFAYPKQTVYAGAGDPKLASSWVARQAGTLPSR